MKTRINFDDAIPSNVNRACEHLHQAIACLQRAWIANPPANEYVDEVLSQAETLLSNVLEMVRTIVK